LTAEVWIVDASIAVKWVVDEPDSAAAVALMDGRPRAAPSYILVEAANAIRKQCAAGKITPEAAALALYDLFAAPLERIPVDEALVADALTLAIDLAHPVQDCLYLALARRSGARVITADRKFARAVRASPAHAASIVLLGE
jgi:predicted nucleic acid-binding protein